MFCLTATTLFGTRSDAVLWGNRTYSEAGLGRTREDCRSILVPDLNLHFVGVFIHYVNLV